MIRYTLAALITLAPLPALAQTAIEEIVTPAGITVWLKQETSIPIVSVEVRIRGGSSIDPVGQEGAATLVMGLLEEGSGDLDSVGYARAAEELAAGIGFSAYRDTVAVSATMLRENRAEVIELTRMALQDPRFDQDAIDRVKAQIVSNLRSSETDPSSIASAEFFKLAFPDHPYSRPTDGTIDTITALTADDLRAVHRNIAVRDRAFVSVVGDVTADEAAQLVDALLADLPIGGPDLPKAVEMQNEGQLVVIDLPSPQSQALFGHRGIARDDPDFFAAFVMSRILGGSGFASRLTEEVREKRGLTYGVSASLASLDYGPLYIGSVASANETMAEAVEVIRTEWRRMAEGGATNVEIAEAKQFLTGAYPLRFDTNAKVADILVGVQEGELGIEYTQIRNSLIDAVTAEDIARVATRLLREDALTFVIVGQPEGFE